jgi:hypothetical protein
MLVTEAHIAELLKTLEALLKQIAPLRTRVAEIEEGLAQTQREYESKLGQANAEAERLEGLKRSVLARLNPVPEPELPTPPPTPDPTPPPPLIKPEPGIAPPQPPPETPRVARKRALLDYIFYFADAGETTVIEKINAIVDDERHDVGDILELLTWGDIWRARPDWETLADQWKRLDGWRAALDQRVTVWQQAIRRLEDNDYYELWKRKSELSTAEWQSFLDQLLQQQEADNKRLADEIAKLEQRWQPQASASGTNNG